MKPNVPAERAAAFPESSVADDDTKVQFNRWMREYNKTFTEDAIPFRFQVWKQHFDFIAAHNRENHTYLLGMNADGAMTDDEFRRLRLGYLPINQSVLSDAAEEDVPLSFQVPSSVDWRLQGAVTPIKDQGDCGSCYTFVATATIEGAMVLQGSPLVSLSESQLLDCTKPYGNQGCNGGLMDNCYKYAVAKGGVCSEEEYPYKPKVSTCRSANCKTVPGTHIRDFVKVRKNDEKSALLQAVAKQPVAVAVQGDSTVFRFYKSGIFDNVKCGTNLNHAVAAIGYDTSPANLPFWILKNQWGISWGEEGFMRLIRNKNVCGVAKDASYPRF